MIINPAQTFVFRKYTSKSISSSKSISKSFFVLLFLFSDCEVVSSAEMNTDVNTAHFCGLFTHLARSLDSLTNHKAAFVSEHHNSTRKGKSCT